jgi:hypothetical protein
MGEKRVGAAQKRTVGPATCYKIRTTFRIRMGEKSATAGVGAGDFLSCPVYHEKDQDMTNRSFKLMQSHL